MQKEIIQDDSDQDETYARRCGISKENEPIHSMIAWLFFDITKNMENEQKQVF